MGPYSARPAPPARGSPHVQTPAPPVRTAWPSPPAPPTGEHLQAEATGQAVGEDGREVLQGDAVVAALALLAGPSLGNRDASSCHGPRMRLVPAAGRAHDRIEDTSHLRAGKEVVCSSGRPGGAGGRPPRDTGCSAA